MNIKQGRKYLNGYGQIIEIVDLDINQKPYIFIGSNGESYTEHGTYDLIEPYTTNNLTHLVISDAEANTMQAKIDELTAMIEAAKNCLVCAVISEPYEVIQTTLELLGD